MAQLENTGGLGAGNIARPDVSVSHSTDGGLTWSEPVTVLKGQGNGANATNAKFWDKEWLTVDNNPDSDWYGRAYLTATLFQNGRQGSYLNSPIYFSWSDDGGLTWSTPKVISGSNADYCTYQETGPDFECDEDQFSIPTVAPDGTLHVHFLNGQHGAAWEVPIDFDNQIMVVSSDDGGATFNDPVHVVDLEDGYSDMPFSVIGRQTVWGHQLRWDAAGNIAVDPTDADHVTVVWADRGDPNPNASVTTDGLPCFLDPFFGAPPDYDPCDAGPGSDTNVYRADSLDGGQTWGPRTLVSAGGGAHQWFPWAGYTPDGTLVAAWDQDDGPAPGGHLPPRLLGRGERRGPRRPRAHRRRRDAVGGPVRPAERMADRVRSGGRGHCRVAGGGGRQGLHRLPRRLHGPGRGQRRSCPHRVDGPEPPRDDAPDRLRDGPAPRRVRPGRDVRASLSRAGRGAPSSAPRPGRHQCFWASNHVAPAAVSTSRGTRRSATPAICSTTIA